MTDLAFQSYFPLVHGPTSHNHFHSFWVTHLDFYSFLSGIFKISVLLISTRAVRRLLDPDGVQFHLHHLGHHQLSETFQICYSNLGRKSPALLLSLALASFISSPFSFFLHPLLPYVLSHTHFTMFLQIQVNQ